MNAFELVLMPEAQTDIRGLSAAIQTRVLDRIEWAAEEIRVLKVGHRSNVYE